MLKRETDRNLCALKTYKPAKIHKKNAKYIQNCQIILCQPRSSVFMCHLTPGHQYYVTKWCTRGIYFPKFLKPLLLTGIENSFPKFLDNKQLPIQQIILFWATYTKWKFSQSTNITPKLQILPLNYHFIPPPPPPSPLAKYSRI